MIYYKMNKSEFCKEIFKGYYGTEKEMIQNELLTPSEFNKLKRKYILFFSKSFKTGYEIVSIPKNKTKKSFGVREIKE